MRTFDLSPLYRSTVGFDRMATLMDQLLASDTAQPSYPPYNIEKTGDDAYRISIAVAGFGENDLNIEVKEGQLTVTANKVADDKAEKTGLPAPRHRRARVRAALPAGRPCARRWRRSGERAAAHRSGARDPRGAEAADHRDPLDHGRQQDD